MLYFSTLEVMVQVLVLTLFFKLNICVLCPLLYKRYILQMRNKNIMIATDYGSGVRGMLRRASTGETRAKRPSMRSQKPRIETEAE